ncbi:helix-turn-helix domain-containing protein [Methylobacterium sp. CM6244]
MAREARALRQRELAALVDRPDSTVSKWESGLQRPEPNTIPGLAEALDVHPNWFFKPLDVDNHAVFYRSMIAELKTLRKRARARLGFVEAAEQEIAEYIGLPEIDIPDALNGTDFRDLRSDDIEAIADDLRSHWSLENGPLSDILLLMENAGVVVAEDEIGSVKLDGVSWWSSRTNRPYVLLARDKKSAVRRRFDAAHEFAHLILHRSVTPSELEEHFTLIESQAMMLAGALLMPAREFKSAVFSISLDGLLSLKMEWGVSVGAMIKRLASLGEISRSNEEQLWKYYSARKWRLREPYDAEMKIERPENLRTSIEMMIAEEDITKSELLSSIGLSSLDLVALCGLPEDFFDEKPVAQQRLKPILKLVKSGPDDLGSDATVIPFQRGGGR